MQKHYTVHKNGPKRVRLSTKLASVLRNIKNWRTALISAQPSQTIHTVMKFLKTSIALLMVLGMTIAAKHLGIASVVKELLTHEVEATPEVVEQSPKSKSVFEVADSICQAVGVPYDLVVEIGNNESGWRYIENSNGGTDFGDLQVIDKTFWYWYERLELSGGKTRRNYLAVGIHYLRYQYERYGSWEKARFAYGRGNWREPSTWTCLEEKFMGKINWSKYDRANYVKK